MKWAPKIGVAVALLAGLVAVVYLIWQIGFDSIFSAVARAGFGGLALLCLFALVVFVSLAFAWYFLLPPPQRLRLREFYIARLVRDSIAEISPFSPVGGMVAAARLMVLKGMSPAHAAASVAGDATTEAMAQVVFLAFGLGIGITQFRHLEGSGPLTQAMLAVLLLAIVADIYGIGSLPEAGGAAFNVMILIVATLTFVLVMPGFYMLQPNQAVAITLFGDYRGTDRTTGLRWTWPWMGKKKVSVRANNFISDKIKVNDLRGNPIEMAAQIVWRVVDTAQALFDVDDYKQFVRVQVEAAIRTIGSRYPYDDFEHQEVTLRGNHDQVGVELRTELQARLAVAGITVDECGFTHLAYAQEIAGAMLRRQQAQAVVAARKTLVEGAVGMVEMALEMLSEKNVVELDDERRAAMVSNLMVVLCGERDTQPVVNTGTLYT